MGMMKQIWDEIEQDDELAGIHAYATKISGRSESDDLISEMLLDTIIEVARDRIDARESDANKN